MLQFQALRQAYQSWIASYSLLRRLLPYHYHFLFGGLGLLFIQRLLLNMYFFKLNGILFPLGHYGFIAGIWLTLAAEDRKYLCYALWAYAFCVLFPFNVLSLYMLLEAALYGGAGYLLKKYDADTEAIVSS